MAKRGPAKWFPSDEQINQIKLYAGLGVTQAQCAKLIGVGEKTFRDQADCKDAFDEGKAQTIAKIAGSLVKKALAGDTVSQIFYLKTQAGWKETATLELTKAEPIRFIRAEAPKSLPTPENGDG